MSVFSIIQRPVLTEKSRESELNGIYTVLVSPHATKTEVKIAFHTLYGVEVNSVNIIKVREKYHQTKRGVQVKRKNQVKALVSLKKGQKISDFQKLTFKAA